MRIALSLLALFSFSILAGEAASDLTFVKAPKPLPAGAVTSDWLSFLGPTHNATCPETKLLKKFGLEGPPLVWELKRGSGYASPAIQGEKLIYIHRVDNNNIVVCLHPETGKEIWRYLNPTQYKDRYGYNNGPRSSPVIDGDFVYLYTQDGVLIALKMADGKEVWQKDLNKEYKIEPNFFGVGTTPVIEGDKIIINVGAADGPCVIGLNKLTGEKIWGANANGWGPSYASPTPATIHGKRRVLVFAGGESRPATGGLVCLDPENGKVDFTQSWRSDSYESVNCASPVVQDNQIFITASYETGGMMITVNPDFTHKVEWKSDGFGSHMTTPVVKDGYLYGFDGRHTQNSQLVCFEWKTGKEIWRKTVEWEEKLKVRGQERVIPQTPGRGELILVDGHVLCTGENGHLLWLDLTPQGPTVLSRTWMFTSPESWTPPVISRGLLYICQNHADMAKGTEPRLLCFDLRGE
jgi:outer membrane protein assembly factor BamB